MQEIIIRPAEPSEQRHALQILFQAASWRERPELVTRAQELLASGELAPAGLLVAEQRHKIVGTILANLAPGNVAVVWPPQVLHLQPVQAIEDLLVRDALTGLAGRGVRLAHTLLRTQEASLAQPLLRHGFRHVTRLLFLRRSLERTVEVEEPQGLADSALGVLAFEPYTPQNANLLAETLIETYQGTLDCPELNGKRSLEEVMIGHRAQGRHDPNLWWLVREGVNPIGVLLLAPARDEPSWELIYMGLLPCVRGRGLGRQLVQRALAVASRAGVPELTLSVDARNDRARDIYGQLQFRVVDEREVFLCFFDPVP